MTDQNFRSESSSHNQFSRRLLLFGYDQRSDIVAKIFKKEGQLAGHVEAFFSL